MSRLGNIGGRLYRGEVSLDFVGRQRLWYAISGLIVVVSVASLSTLGLNLGIEFKGGSVFQFAAPQANTSQVRDAVKATGEVEGDPIVQQTRSTGGKETWRVQTETLSYTKLAEVQQDLAKDFGLKGPSEVSVQTVGASWGRDISQKALQGLIIFLLLVVAYLWISFEWKMSLAALIALAHDLLITVGVYSLVQFEVTPATVIGLLTILGYSLYDTVVVFDKVRENTRNLGTGSGPLVTYSDAANLALNQTLVRSINTSVTALLPVAGLLFIGAGVLQAGTLKDLALVLFVGMLAGTYSSICIATPVLADIKEREPKFRQLRERVKARQASPKRRAKAEKAGERAGGAKADKTERAAAAAEAIGSDQADDDTESAPAAVTVRKVVQTGPRQQPKRGSRQRRRGGGK